MANDELIAAAEQAPFIGQVRGFLSWLGEGRKLTQTGRIGLADARHLVELLDTGDEMDPEIGGRVFKTKSSEELGGLMRVTEWAKAARLTRVTGAKLVPVRKNAVLADKPLDLVLKLLEAYPKIGKPLFPRGHWRQSLVGDEFDVIGPALIDMLLRTPGPCPLAELGVIADALISSMYMLDSLAPVQRERLQDLIDADTRIAMSHLHVLGVVNFQRNSDEVGEYGNLDWSKGTVELTALGQYAVRRLRGAPAPGDPVLTIRVTLLDVDRPRVWRRVVVPAAYTLDRMHMVIQEAMGWTNSHLHGFRIAGHEYGITELDEIGRILEEKDFRLGELVKPGDVIEYLYDYGDSWDHEIVIEDAGEAAADAVYPACADGAGACPPEDCGGAPGFGELKEILAGPASAQREEMRAWTGSDYDPNRFDLAAANTAVGAV
jgi:hypothetical protein